MPINPTTGLLEGIGRAADIRAPQHTEPADGEDFKKYLLDNLNKVNTMQQDAGKMVTDMVMGREQDITKVMTAMEILHFQPKTHLFVLWLWK